MSIIIQIINTISSSYLNLLKFHFMNIWDLSQFKCRIFPFLFHQNSLDGLPIFAVIDLDNVNTRRGPSSIPETLMFAFG